MRPQYVYRIVSVVRVVDGDTVWLNVDVGFRQTLLTNVRLLGCDTPERNSGSAFEKAEAKRATSYTTEWFRDIEAWIRTEKDPDNFGRWLGDVWRYTIDGTERHLASELANVGLATVYPERWRDVYDV